MQGILLNQKIGRSRGHTDTDRDAVSRKAVTLCCPEFQVASEKKRNTREILH